MRAMLAVALALLAALSSAFGSAAYAEPLAGSDISFGLPFPCSTEGSTRRCLVDAFEAGRNVVLMNETQSCSARTAGTFTEEYAYEQGKATHLEGNAKCVLVEPPTLRDPWRFRVAVVGADPASVRLISPEDDQSPVRKGREVRARRLVNRTIVDLRKKFNRNLSGISLSPTPPKVLRVGNITLLIFYLQQDGVDGEVGPMILCTNNNAFRLLGFSTHEPFFFSVNDKLHLAYTASLSCCGCGEVILFVYDLSGTAPRKVYANGKFSD